MFTVHKKGDEIGKVRNYKKRGLNWTNCANCAYARGRNYTNYTPFKKGENTSIYCKEWGGYYSYIKGRKTKSIKV